MNSTRILNDIIWPANHAPIIFGANGLFFLVDENNCQTTFAYDLYDITKVFGQIAFHANLIWKDNRSILTVSGYNAVYQIDLNSSQLIKTFSLVNETTLTVVYEYTLYSKSLSHIYVLTQNNSDTKLVYSIYIWENNNQTKTPIKVIKLPENILPSQLSNLKESDSGLLWALHPLPTELTTTVHTFDVSGTLTTKITRIISQAFAINDGNLFDVVAILDIFTYSLDVLKLDDGQSLQKLYLPKNSQFIQTQYQNRVLILLDKTGQVLTYLYEDDILQPDDGSGSTTWIVIVCVVVGVLIIAGAVVYFIRKKKLAQKQSGNYGKLNDEV